MKCPRCKGHSDLEGNRCFRCGSVYDAADLEEYSHVAYLLKKLEEWGALSELPLLTAVRLREATLRDQRRLERALGLNLPQGSKGPSASAARTGLATTDSYGHLPDHWTYSLEVPGKAATGRDSVVTGRVFALSAGEALAIVYRSGEKLIEQRVQLQKGYQTIQLPLPVPVADLLGLQLQLLDPETEPQPELPPQAAEATPEESPAGEQPSPRTPLGGILEGLVDSLGDLVTPSSASPTAALEQAESAVDALLAGPEGTEALQTSRATGRRMPSLPSPANAASLFTGRDFSWRQIGSYLLSERTLHALLVLGTFLILASGFVISTLNPTRLPPLWHLGAVAATTLIFHLVGYFARFRLRLVTTGSALMAIGGAFIPLNVATLGQERLLDWEPAAVWMVASLISLPIFFAFHALLRDRPFALFTALAGASELLSVLNWLGVSAEWAAALLIGLSIVYIRLGWRLRQSWTVLAWGLFWVAQTAVPAVLASMKGSLAIPLLGQLIPGLDAATSLSYAVAATWWLGSLFYWVCSSLSERQRYRVATAWAVPFAYLFTLDSARVNPSWYNFALALLPAGYALLGWWGGRRQPGTTATKLRDLLADPISQAGLAATLEAAFWPNQSLAARGPSLIVVAFTYAVYAIRFRELAVFRYAASYLLAIAAALSLSQLAALGLPWFQPAWHNLAFAILAGGYLLLARYSKLGSVPSSYRGMALEPVYQVILALTLTAAFWPEATRRSMVLTLLALTVLFAAATNLLRQRAPAYVSAVLLPAAYGFAPPLLGLDPAFTILGWALLGGAMLVAAETVARRSGDSSRTLQETVMGIGNLGSRFASPLFLAGYSVSLVAGVFCFETFLRASSAGPRVLTPPPVIAAGLTVVAMAMISAKTRRSSLFLYPAVVLFLVPYLASAGHVAYWLGRPPSQGGLAQLLSLLGAVYVAMGARVDRFRGHYAKPIYLAGYVLSVLAILVASGDRSSRVLVVGIALLVYAWSAWRMHRRRHPSFDWLVRQLAPPTSIPYAAVGALFLYLTSWLFPLWVVLGIDLAAQGGSAQQYGLATAALAPVYVAMAFKFRRIRQLYRWPWFLAGYALSGIGPLLALGLPLRIGGFVVYHIPFVQTTFHPASLVVALGISIALYAESFRRFDRRPWLYLASWLFLPWLGFALSLWEPRPPLSVYAVAFGFLGPVYVFLGRRFDRLDREYRWPWYWSGYALSVLGPLLAWQDALSSASGIGLLYAPPLVLCLLASVGLYAASFWVSLLRIWLVPVAGLFPVAMVLAMRVVLPPSLMDPYGIALSTLAATYVAVGWRLRGFGRPYQEPWFIGAYVLSVLGPVVALLSAAPNMEALRFSHLASIPFLLSLAISTGIYLVGAWPLRQPDWLYPGAALLPLLVVSTLQRVGVGTPTYDSSLLLLALGYMVAGTVIHYGSPRMVRLPISGTPSPYALPLFAAGQVICVLALWHLLPQGGGERALGFLLGSLVYAGSAVIFRRHQFATPAAISLAVVYVSTVSLPKLPWDWYGVHLFPGIVAFLAIAETLRRRPGLAWGKSFYILAYTGTAVMVVWSALGPLWYLGWWGAVAAFAISSWLLRSPVWLYPALLSTIGGYLTTLDRVTPPLSPQDAVVALIVPVWLFAWTAHIIAVKVPGKQDGRQHPLLGTEGVWSHWWASPFLICAALVLTLSVMGGASQPSTGLVTAIAYTLLTGGLALLWAGELEAWIATGLAVSAFEQWLLLGHVPWVEEGPHNAVLALCLGALSILSHSVEKKGIAAWRRPLEWGSALVGAAAPLSAVVCYLSLPSDQAFQMLAATVSISGLTLIAHGFARRMRLLGYLGVAAVEGGYMLELTRMQVGQPQAFALPAGAYLLAVAFLEWRRGDSSRLKKRIEQAGISLLLGVSLIQAVGQLGNGHDRYLYDLFLFCESLLLFALGAVLRWKRTFLWSINALVIDVLILLADPVKAMNTWYLVGITGVIMIGLVLFAEQRRQQIPGWINEWRQQIDNWS